MIDTLKLVSPPISAAAAEALNASAVHRIAYDAATERELWHLTTAELEGSYDHRVRFRLVDNCIRLEGSVHKLMLGHNIYGGSDDLLACARFLVCGVAALLGEVLPKPDLWQVHGVDYAQGYMLGSFDSVEGYFRACQGVSYPRRKVARYAFQSISVPGRTTTLKLYHKGPEFAAHDRKRLKPLVSHEELCRLQELADTVLRSEVSIRRRLVEDFEVWPLVGQVTGEYLQRVHNSEMARLVREGHKEMQTVRTYMEVKRRLYETYTEHTARVLVGTWMQLSAMGEAETKKGMKPRTFYLHRKQLLEAACSWHSSDIHQGAQIFPADFIPLTTDPRAMKGEAPQVAAFLDQFRKVD